MGQGFLNCFYPFDTRAVHLFVNTPLYIKCEYFVNQKKVEGGEGGAGKGDCAAYLKILAPYIYTYIYTCTHT